MKSFIHSNQIDLLHESVESRDDSSPSERFEEEFAVLVVEVDEDGTKLDGIDVPALPMCVLEMRGVVSGELRNFIRTLSLSATPFWRR